MRHLLLVCSLFVGGLHSSGQGLSPLKGQWKKIVSTSTTSLTCGQSLPSNSAYPMNFGTSSVDRFYSKLFIAGEFTNCLPQTQQVIVSSDDGVHWASLAGFSDIGNLSSMAVSDALYLFGDKGFVISKDGANWDSPVQIPNCNGPYDTETKGVLVICNYNAQVFRSVDHGSTWTPVPLTPLPPNGCANTTQLIVSGDVLIKNCFEHIGGAPGQAIFVPHLFRSSDLGNTWEETGPNYYTAAFLPQVVGRRNLYLGATTIDGGIVGDKVFISKDHGLTWYLQASSGVPIPYESMLEMADSRVCTGSPAPSAGVYCSGDRGYTWQWLVNGLPTKQTSAYAYSYPRSNPIANSNGLFIIVGAGVAPGGTGSTPGDPSLWEFQQQ
jgi:hypothetical protein